jgi:hypothetical protein
MSSTLGVSVAVSFIPAYVPAHSKPYPPLDPSAGRYPLVGVPPGVVRADAGVCYSKPPDPFRELVPRLHPRRPCGVGWVVIHLPPPVRIVEQRPSLSEVILMVICSGLCSGPRVTHPDPAYLFDGIGDFNCSGADGGGRTRTALRPRDFKSLASTGFATSA